MWILLLATLARADEPVRYPVLTYGEIADGRGELEEGFVERYEAGDGYPVTVGDVLRLGEPSGSSARVSVVGANVSGSATSYGVGVASGSSWYAHIANGTWASTIGKSVLAGIAQMPDPALIMAPASLTGTDVRVVRMKLGGTRKHPVVWMECAFVASRESANASGLLTITDYDTAVRVGEVRLASRPLNRTEAIAHLKEAKDLLDLGVYTPERYEAEKAAMLPFLGEGPAAPPPEQAAVPIPEPPPPPPLPPNHRLEVVSQVGDDGYDARDQLHAALVDRVADVNACMAEPGAPVRLDVTVKRPTGELLPTAPLGEGTTAVLSARSACVGAVVASIRLAGIAERLELGVALEDLAEQAP
jgi:hypothetical protein